MTTMPYRFPRAGSATRSSPVKTGMIADGSLASIREDARTIFKDRPLTDDCLFANSIWPEPELLGLVDDLTGRTGRNL